MSVIVVAPNTNLGYRTKNIGIWKKWLYFNKQKNPSAWSDKVEWITKYCDDVFQKRMSITLSKPSIDKNCGMGIIAPRKIGDSGVFV